MTLATKSLLAVANWPLNEASGNASDTVGANTLSDNNTVGSDTGKLFALARDFERDNQEYLSIADNASLRMGDIDWMIRCWVKIESIAGMVVVYKWGLSREYGLGIDGTGHPFVLASTDGTSNPGQWAQAIHSTALSTGTWYLLHGWHDAANNLLAISIDAGTPATVAWSGGTYEGAYPVTVGRNPDNTVQFFDGLIQDVVILKGGYLDSTERTADYNSGNGIPFVRWLPRTPWYYSSQQ